MTELGDGQMLEQDSLPVLVQIHDHAHEEQESKQSTDEKHKHKESHQKDHHEGGSFDGRDTAQGVAWDSQ